METLLFAYYSISVELFEDISGIKKKLIYFLQISNSLYITLVGHV